MSTRIRTPADAAGRPLRFVVTAGRFNDRTRAARLPEDTETAHVIYDGGCDSDGVFEKIEGFGATAVVPPKSNRKGSTASGYARSAT